MIAFRRGLGASTDYTPIITPLATQYGIPPSLALAIAAAESGTPGQLGTGNPNAVSSSGAQGLFQVMPANDASLGISNPFDPQQNAAGGLKLLQGYYQQYGDWNLALEAYNEGPGHLNAQLTAGTTPVSAGYASGILAAAGIDSSSPSPSDSASADSLLPSFDLSTLTDLPTETGLSWTTLGAIGAGILALVIALSMRR